jgi:hypothetical protein
LRACEGPNKNTRILKDALLDAALALGFPKEVAELDDDNNPTGVIKMLKTGVDGMQGYFEWLGLNNPRSFAALLGRVLPTQLNIKTSSTSLKIETGLNASRPRQSSKRQ